MLCIKQSNYRKYRLVCQSVFQIKDIKFKQIVNKYTSIVTDKVNSLDKGDSFYIEWNSKNKYNKNYYMNSVYSFFVL